MNVGDVFLWDTDNVIGYQRRFKYHVFIRPGDWQYDNTFLFVNKSDYGGDYPLRNTVPHEFLPLPMSYVGCGAIIQYDDDDLQGFADQPVGLLLTKVCGVCTIACSSILRCRAGIKKLYLPLCMSTSRASLKLLKPFTA